MPPTAADYSEGKAMQTISPQGILTCRTVYAFCDQAPPTADGVPPYSGPTVGADAADLIAWVNDFDITTLAWGTMITAPFGDLFPASGGPGEQAYTDAPIAMPTISGNPSFNSRALPAYSGVWPFGGGEGPHYSRSQISVYFPGNVTGQYMVIESTDQVALSGCTSPVIASGFVLDIPLPDVDTPLKSQSQLIFALVGSASSGPPYSAPDLDTFVSLLGYTTGPDWNAGLACLVPTGPPFA